MAIGRMNAGGLAQVTLFEAAPILIGALMTLGLLARQLCQETLAA